MSLSEREREQIAEELWRIVEGVRGESHRFGVMHRDPFAFVCRLIPERVAARVAAAREEADRQWRALVDPLQEAVFEFDVCEPCEAPTVWRRVLRAARPVRRALAADIRKGDGDE